MISNITFGYIFDSVYHENTSRLEGYYNVRKCVLRVYDNILFAF